MIYIFIYAQSLTISRLGLLALIDQKVSTVVFFGSLLFCIITHKHRQNSKNSPHSHPHTRITPSHHRRNNDRALRGLIIYREFDLGHCARVFADTHIKDSRSCRVRVCGRILYTLSHTRTSLMIILCVCAYRMCVREGVLLWG